MRKILKYDIGKTAVVQCNWLQKPDGSVASKQEAYADDSI